LKNVWQNGFICWFEIVKCPSYPLLFLSFFLKFLFSFFPTILIHSLPSFSSLSAGDPLFSPALPSPACGGVERRPPLLDPRRLDSRWRTARRGGARGRWRGEEGGLAAKGGTRAFPFPCLRRTIAAPAAGLDCVAGRARILGATVAVEGQKEGARWILGSPPPRRSRRDGSVTADPGELPTSSSSSSTAALSLRRGELPISHRLASSPRIACPPGGRAGKSWRGAAGDGRCHSFVAPRGQNSSKEQDFRGSIPELPPSTPFFELWAVIENNL
jgi:hypothetical protein